MLLFTVTLVVLFGRFSAQQELPVKTPVRSADGGSNGACPADEVLTQLRNNTSMDVQSVLEDTVLPASPCPCVWWSWTMAQDSLPQHERPRPAVPD